MTSHDPAPHRWAGLGRDTAAPGPPPPSSPPPPPPPPAQQPDRAGKRRGVLAGAGVVAVLAPVVGAFWWGRSGATSATATTPPVTSAPEASTPPSPTTGEPAVTPPREAAASAASSERVSTTPPVGTDPATEAAALAELQRTRETSLATADLDGRWVAQVVSEAVGTVDPLQTAASGTHTFYASDILDQMTSVNARVDGQLSLLSGTDYGPRSTAPNGQPWWNPVTQQGFSSSDEVLAWCASQFSELSGDALENACIPCTLAPPS